MKDQGAAIDWEEARARLERLARALAAGGEPPPEEARRILLERARALAQPREEAPAPAETLDLLVFSLGGERYGVENAYVQEVVRLRELTPVPCTPPFVVGVVSHRGRILPVLDLRKLLELPGQGLAEVSQVVAVEAGGMSFGLLTDAVEGTRRVGAEDVTPRPAGLSGGGPAVFRGVTAGMVAVLDLEALARDPRIVVGEQVGSAAKGKGSP